MSSNFFNQAILSVQHTVGVLIIFVTSILPLPFGQHTTQTTAISGEKPIPQDQLNKTTSTKIVVIPSPTPLSTSNPKENKTLWKIVNTPIPTQISLQPQAVTIEHIDPSTTNFGETLTIKGNEFGSAQGKVLFTNNPGIYFGAYIDKWSNQEIQVVVPPTAGNQKFKVLVETAKGTKSNGYEVLIVGGQPIIHILSPEHLMIGGQMTINGSRFGEQKGRVNIYKPESIETPLVQCSVVTWNDNQIVCDVPNGPLEIGIEYGFQVINSSGQKSSFVYQRFDCTPTGCG